MAESKPSHSSTTLGAAVCAILQHRVVEWWLSRSILFCDVQVVQKIGPTNNHLVAKVSCMSVVSGLAYILALDWHSKYDPYEHFSNLPAVKSRHLKLPG